MPTTRQLYPDPLEYNLVRYFGIPPLTIHIYDPTNHVITIDQEPDIGYTSPAAYINSGYDTPDDTNGWYLGGNPSLNQSSSFNIDITFSQIGYYPDGDPYISLVIRSSGQYLGTNSYASGLIINPYLYFKKSVNTFLANDIPIASSLYLNDSEPHLFFAESGHFTNSSARLEVIDDYTNIVLGVPNGQPSLSGTLIFWHKGPMKISEMALSFLGNDPVTTGVIPLFLASNAPSSGYPPLYTYGDQPISSGIPLYLQQSEAEGSTNLFLQGYYESSGSFNLFTMAGVTQRGTDLYIYGDIPLDSGINLNIVGQLASASGIPLYSLGTGPIDTLPLFLQGAIPDSDSGSFPLNIWSTTNSGLFDHIPLYLQFAADYPDRRYSLNLVSQGPTSLPSTSYMNMVVYQDTNINNDIDLFIQNNTVSSGSYITLFMSTESGTYGAVPVRSNMNLYMNRLYNSVASAAPMFLKNYDISSGNLPVYIMGAPTADSSVPLYVRGGSSSSYTSTLYSHGH